MGFPRLPDAKRAAVIACLKAEMRLPDITRQTGVSDGGIRYIAQCEDLTIKKANGYTFKKRPRPMAVAPTAVLDPVRCHLAGVMRGLKW